MSKSHYTFFKCTTVMSSLLLLNFSQAALAVNVHFNRSVTSCDNISPTFDQILGCRLFLIYIKYQKNQNYVGDGMGCFINLFFLLLSLGFKMGDPNLERDYPAKKWGLVKLWEAANGATFWILENPLCGLWSDCLQERCPSQIVWANVQQPDWVAQSVMSDTDTRSIMQSGTVQLRPRIVWDMGSSPGWWQCCLYRLLSTLATSHSHVVSRGGGVVAGGINLQWAAAAWANSKMEWETRNIWNSDDKVCDSQHILPETSTQQPSIHIICIIYLYLHVYLVN